VSEQRIEICIGDMISHRFIESIQISLPGVTDISSVPHESAQLILFFLGSPTRLPASKDWLEFTSHRSVF
jgi:hypothetical protein